MKLPAPLKPWSDTLSALNQPVIDAIGPWLVRLDLLIGPLAAAMRSGRTELDGLSGLARRGPYDRLLLSEWALAEEVPDEFVRRAAMGEHLFLEPDRREPAGKQHSAAVFDCGPDQLGRPRLAHLAIAVVLARRARAAQIPFFVDTFDSDAPPAAWEGLSTLTQLIARRTLVPTTDGLVKFNAASLAFDDVRDRFAIGGPAVRAFDGRWLQVTDGDAHLAVECGSPGRPPRKIELALPAPREAVRVLRDPLGARRQAPRSAQAPPTGAEMRFSADGRRLLMRRQDGTLVALFLPNTPSGQWGRERTGVPPKGRALEAVGWLKRRFVWIAGPPEDGSFRLTPGGFTGVNGDVVPKTESTVSFGSRTLPPMALFPGTRSVLFSDDHGVLLRWSPVAQPHAAFEVDKGTFGLAYRWGTACWARFEGGRRVVRYCYDAMVPASLPLDLGPGPPIVWFGPAAGHSFPTGTAVAPGGDGHYVVIRATPQPKVVERLEIHTPHQVFGAGTFSAGGALWAVDSSRTKLLAIPLADAPPTVLATTPSPVLHVEADPCTNRFAWREASGRLVVWSVADNKPLIELSGMVASAVDDDDDRETTA